MNASCFGANNGSVIINGTGGSGTYIYSINGGISTQASNQFANLPAGSYNLVIIDTAGCRDTSTVLISSPAAINVNVVTVSASCNNSNGSITVNGVGGIGALQYSNDNGISFQASNVFLNQAAGNYAIVVKDANGCTGNSNAAVNNLNAPVISGIPYQNVSCHNGNNGSIS